MDNDRERQHSSILKIFLTVLLAVFTVGAVFVLCFYHYECSGVGLPAERAFIQNNIVSAIPIEPVKEIVTADAEEEAADSSGEIAGEEAPEEELPAEDYYSDTVTFAFAGDILFDRSYAVGEIMYSRGGFAPCLDQECLRLMRSANIMIINNEFPYIDSGTPQENKEYTFHAPRSTVTWLAEAGVDLVALANNHVYDYGKAGFDSTLKTLKAVNMPYIGAGNNLEEAMKPACYSFGNMKIAVFNATQIERYANPNTKGADAESGGVFRCYDPTLLYQAVAEAKKTMDYVIVFVHWGTEKESTPDWMQLEQAQGLEAAGADLVVGAHPHRVQSVGYVNDMPVIYSIGNFDFTTFQLDVLLLQVTLRTSDKSLASVRLVPMQQMNGYVTTLSGSEKERVLQGIRSTSPSASIDEDGYMTKN